MPETVWAIHNFEAEAEDEISFHIGEPIIIVQKDELYQDGWWEGTNVRGQTGLFPQNYTVKNPAEQTAGSVQPPRHANGYGGAESRPVDGNGTFGASSTNTSSNLNHIANHIQQHVGSNSSNGNFNNKSSGLDNRVQMQQSNQTLNTAMNSMHIQQNPKIASPPAGSVRGGYGGSIRNGTSGAAPNSKLIAQSVEESLNNPQLAGHPSLWSIDQVAYWLELCGFGNVAASFIDNEISGAILMELNLNNLKELEINSFGKRFNIMNAITSLKQTTKGPKSPYGTHTNSMGPLYPSGQGPNIPPRMASAPISIPSAMPTYDLRSDYMRDPRQGLQDPRSAPISLPPLPPASIQSPPMRQQLHHQSDYDSQSRVAAVTRSDTLGSLPSGGSMGDYPVPSVDSELRGANRQSLTSAYSSTVNNSRNQWGNTTRPSQMSSSAAVQQQQGGPGKGEFDDGFYGVRPPAQPAVDQYPRPMDQVGPTSPDLRSPSYGGESFQQPVPKPRKFHNPDSTNRQRNGKADPSDKVVSLELIGKPDFAGWLKKRGDTYRTWKSRWFILKGVTLYYTNSPKDLASKDYINLIGYKIIQDENIYAGKYCFKAVHDELRNFFFYTDSETEMKGWLKALMKVTIGRDPNAPVISSSNIPTISLHVARQMAPRPPSPSKRPRALGPNGQSLQMQQAQLQQQQHQQQRQLQLQQQQDLLYQQQLQSQPLPSPPSSQQQQKSFQQQLLDYDDQESDGDDYIPNTYEGPRSPVHQSTIPNSVQKSQPTNGSHGQQLPESPILQGLHAPNQQHRDSFVKLEKLDGDDDPWRDEDGEGFGKQKSQLEVLQQQQQQQQQQKLKNVRPDSDLDSFGLNAEESERDHNASWTQEHYVAWINRNLPAFVEPVTDMTQSLRSGVVLVRLIEQLAGEQVEKRIPNATYTLQMLENLLTAFKFMDRVGISTEGYTVKDIFNGNEPKIVLMFESIRAKFPSDALSPPTKATLPNVSLPSSPALSSGPLPNGPPALPGPAPSIQVPRGSPLPNGGNKASPRMGNGPAYFPNSSSPITLPQPPQQPPQQPPMQISQQPTQQRMQAQKTGGSEFEALYDEAARSTVS